MRHELRVLQIIHVKRELMIKELSATTVTKMNILACHIHYVHTITWKYNGSCYP